MTYVGITGICTVEDIVIAQAALPLVPSGHRFMTGVLVSHKTLNGGVTTNRRYPPVSDVPFLIDELANLGGEKPRSKGSGWPVIHYNTSGCTDPLADQLQRLMDRFPQAQGIQLNVVRPDPEKLRTFRTGGGSPEIILQVNEKSVPGLSPREVREYVSRYEGLAEYALLDLSGGDGKPVNALWATTILNGWDPPMKLGLAGGLGPKFHLRLGSLTPWIGGLSFDAETGVRVPVDDPIPGERYQDRLDMEKVQGYMMAAHLAKAGL